MKPLIVVGLLLLGLVPGTAFGQTGRVSGSVTNEAGVPVPGVAVTIVAPG